MSDDGPMLPWETAETAQRKRAALTLGALALIAVLLVGILLVVLNKSDNSHKNSAPLAGPGPTRSSGAAHAPITSQTTSQSTRPPTSHRRTTRAPSTKPRPRTTKLTCNSGPVCVVPGDPGSALDALNTYRTSHGRQAVAGAVTKDAQTCAVNNGDSTSCPQSYFWEPVTGHDGTAVIAKIAGNGDGARFLLDPQVRTVRIGWAYIPSSGGYQCAVINVY